MILKYCNISIFILVSEKILVKIINYFFLFRITLTNELLISGKLKMIINATNYTFFMCARHYSWACLCLPARASRHYSHVCGKRAFCFALKCDYNELWCQSPGKSQYPCKKKDTIRKAIREGPHFFVSDVYW